ncbi:LamG-like jellyroll fold domain-containing protein [Vibrio harveyi]|uniref:LamG domain-containing protein n=2 Tax=Vibrio TaxID=662 RepID=UPI0036F29049
MSLDLSSNVSPLFIQVVARNKYGQKFTSSIKKLVPLDSDEDHLPDHLELSICSDPNNADSDGDGLSDGIEMGAETGRYLGDPCKSDTDGDGIDDAYEYAQGWNLQDFDVAEVNEQGLSHWEEYAKAQSKLAESNGKAVISGEHVLDVTDKKAFAYTGFIPSSKQAMTLMYWVKFKTLNERYQLSGAHDGQDHRFYVGLKSSSPIIGVGKGNSTWEEQVRANQWVHLAVVYDDSTREQVLYVSGREVKRERAPTFKGNSVRSLLFGAVHKATGASNFQDARLDDIQVWSRALDSSDVQSYMLTPPQAGEAELLAYYDFSRYRGLWVENVATGAFDMKLSESGLLAVREAEPDSDGDGLSDAFELSSCSDPNNADSDGDGLSDGVELGAKSGRYLSDPCSSDTDGDGIDDAYEYAQGWNLQDFDVAEVNEQGLSHWEEYAKAQSKLAESNGKAVISGEHVLDVTDKKAFAYTGFIPSSKQAMTLMYWVKFKTLNERYQLSGAHDGQDHRFYVGLKSSSPIIGVGKGNSTWEEQVRANQWVHLAVVYDDSTREQVLYVSGREVKRERAPTFKGNSVRSLLFGAVHKATGASNFQDARLDDIQVWSRALDSSDVQSYMLTPPQADEAELLAYYDFSRYRGLWVENVATGAFDMKLSESGLLAVREAEPDSDGDGLSDAFELSSCSDPNNADSDGDGLSDGVELGAKSGRYLSDPCSSDTDGDGIDDAYEYAQGWNLQDFDVAEVNEQGLSHWEEYAKAQSKLAESNGKAVISGEHVLDVTDKKAFAYTGFIPSSKQAMTLMYWVKFKTLNERYQLSGAHDGQDHRFYVGLKSSSPIIGVGKGNSTWEEQVRANQWVHLAVVYDDSTREQVLYVSGREVKRERAPTFKGNSVRSLLFGAVHKATGASNFQDARLDDIQVWSRALDSSDVQSYMLTPPQAGEAELLAYYDFSRYRGLWVENVATGEFDMKLSELNIIKTKTNE